MTTWGLKSSTNPAKETLELPLSMPLAKIPTLMHETDNIYSVVAVHGIGAHPDDTWCTDVNDDASSTTRSVNWLKDPELLPSVMKDARIMRYGYHSQWFGRDALQQSAFAIAPDLLNALKRKREVIKLQSTAIWPRVVELISHRGSMIVL